MGSLKEQILSGVGRSEEIRLQRVKTNTPTKKPTLTAKEEDFILEQARERYYEKKYGVYE